MIRLFSYLALVAGLFLGVTLTLGLTLLDGYELAEKSRHFLFGLTTSLVVMLVNGIVVTYFIGTSRWSKEVVDTYELDRTMIVRGAAQKRRAFLWALFNMLTMVGIAALGAAADPGNSMIEETAAYRIPHLVAAVGGTTLILFGFYQHWHLLHAQHELINDVLTEVRRIRQERGLDTATA